MLSQEVAHTADEDDGLAASRDTAQEAVAIPQGPGEALLLEIHHSDNFLVRRPPADPNLGMQHAADLVDLLGIQRSAGGSASRDEPTQTGQECLGRQVRAREDEPGPQRLLETWTEERGLPNLFRGEIGEDYA